MYADHGLKVNDMVEIVGVLAMDPVWGLPEAADQTTDLVGRCGFEEELHAHCPPASLVARLHCVAVRRLAHTNPALPMPVPAEMHMSLSAIAPACRSHLLHMIQHTLGCDPTVAELLLLHLISHV